VRLGNRPGANGKRGRRRRPAAPGAVAALAVIGSLALTAGPTGPTASAASVDQRRDPQRPSRHPHGDTTAGEGMPARFVAELDGRIVVVSTETGRVERRLTTQEPGGGATEPAVSPDGRTVWFSRGDGSCAAHLASVPVAGGGEQKLPGSGEAGPEGAPLPRPGRDQLAYSRTSCSDSGQALVIGDLRGLEGHGQLGLVPLGWSRDGTRLLATTADGAQVRLLEVNNTGAIVADDELALPDGTAGCTLEVAGFSPDDNGGYVAERRCSSSGGSGAGRRSLVLLDKDGGFRQTVLRLPRGQDFVDSLAFDATGHSLLYSTAPVRSGGTQANEISLWLWRDGTSQLFARQSRFHHPAWLP